MNNEEMKQIMSGDPAAALKDEDKNEFINKIADVFREMVIKTEKDPDTKKSKSTLADTVTPACLVKREYDDKTKQTLMDNMRNYIISSALVSNTNGNAVGNIVLDIAERMIDKLPHKNFVGVQPMQGPVGLIYTLQYRYNDDDEKSDSEEEEPKGYNINGTTGRKMMLEVISQAVEAGSRKFENAAVGIEAIQDDIAAHSEKNAKGFLDDQATIMAQDAYREMKADLFKVAFKEKEVLSLDPKIASMGVCVTINKAASKIAMKTRRGAGNFIITSKEIFNIIKFNSAGAFSKATEEEDKELDYGFIKFMGKLNGNIKVFCDCEMPADKILVGYKGGSGEVDAGYFYCPYIPVMSTGVVVNPTTFQPLINFMTRYGKTSILKTIFDVTENEDGSSESIATIYSSSYYAELTISNAEEVYEIMANMERENPVKAKVDENMEIEETHYRFDEALGTLELID